MIKWFNNLSPEAFEVISLLIVLAIALTIYQFA